MDITDAPSTARLARPASTFVAIFALSSVLAAVPAAHAASGIPGDVNDDYFVSCLDTIATKTAIGLRTGQAGFPAAADLG